MKKSRFYLVSVLILVASAQFTVASDYEAQLAHQMPRFLGAMASELEKNEKISLSLIFMSKERAMASAFASDLGANAVVEEGKWLGYEYRVTARFDINIKSTEMKQWLRKYFFLGIAYHCDLDGWVLENKNAL